ncbi:hypothetical protein L3Q67_26510 [Saccharothrix sp. AJ9571]|nr:hypothetical protein L3Q67_26510 [Saccharothrix sp. AJ9571]
MTDLRIKIAEAIGRRHVGDDWEQFREGYLDLADAALSVPHPGVVELRKKLAEERRLSSEDRRDVRLNEMRAARDVLAELVKDAERERDETRAQLKEAERAMPRDQAQARKVIAEWHAVYAQLARAVVLPDDWRDRVIAQFGESARRDGTPSPRSWDVICLVESWRSAETAVQAPKYQ